MKLNKKTVLAIYRFLKKGGTTREAAAMFGINKATAARIGSGMLRKNVTRHSRIAPTVAQAKSGAKNHGREKMHKSPRIDCLGLTAPRDLVNEAARRLIEDPPFQQEWMQWWLARGREVIAQDENDWATMLNVTAWDYLRHDIKQLASDIERNAKIIKLLKTKKVDLTNGQTIEWRVKYGTQPDQGLRPGTDSRVGKVSPGDGGDRKDHHRPALVQSGVAAVHRRRGKNE